MIAIALIAICFVSGGYALYNNGMADIADTSASDSVTGDSINSNSESSPNNENSLATDVSKSLEIISNSLEPVLKLLDYSSDYSAVTPSPMCRMWEILLLWFGNKSSTGLCNMSRT